MSTVTLNAEYLPLYNKPKGFSLRIPFGKLAWSTVSLPLFSFVFCVIWSILFHFSRSTQTHCNVFNFLPSISSAIGQNSPQREVWQTAIAVHAGPRFVVTAMYFKHYQRVLYARVLVMVGIACVLNVVENLALIGLTFISSSDNYPAHEKCFVAFMVTSEIYMILTCLLLRFMRRNKPDNIGSRSFRVKCQLLAVNVTCFALAGYFFVRHNAYCEPFVFSLFALFEYAVVLTNMGFHMTAYWDFHGKELCVDRRGCHFR